MSSFIFGAHERRWRPLVIIVGLGAVAAQGVRIYFDPSRDFANHWTFGLRFVNREFLYRDGLDVPYPPFWAMAHAPLTLIPAHWAQLLVYPIAVAALVSLVSVLHRLTSKDLKIAPRYVFWIGAGALALASRFIVRDLADAGPNIMLTTLVWCAIYLWARGRPLMAGVALGLATALKLTAGLFIAYFVFRRQWRLAGASALVAIALTLTPALWQGRALYEAHLDAWTRNVTKLLGRPEGLRHERLRIDNIALTPALARHLARPHASEQLSAGSPRWPDPALANLSPVAAEWIIRIITILLIVTVSFAFGRRLLSPRDPRALWECAAVGILALLLSPITWRQHAVAIVPACYLMLRLWASRGALPLSAAVALGSLIIFSLVLNRVLAGERVTWLIHAYSLHTLTLVAMLVATLRCRGGLCEA